MARRVQPLCFTRTSRLFLGASLLGGLNALILLLEVATILLLLDAASSTRQAQKGADARQRMSRSTAFSVFSWSSTSTSPPRVTRSEPARTGT